MGKKSHAKKQRQHATNKAQKTGQSSNVLVPQVTTTELGTKLATQAAGSNQKTLITADYSYVRNDIKRILVLLVVIVAVLAAAVIVNDHSSLLQTAGSKAAHFLQLQ